MPRCGPTPPSPSTCSRAAASAATGSRKSRTRGMSDAEMQALAAEFNLSETAFVLPPEDPAHTARVRIFHRTAEMPFAGHPNVGTGYVLADEGRDRDGVLLFEELTGLVEVRVDRDGAGR